MKRIWILALLGLLLAGSGLNCPLLGNNGLDERIAALRGFDSAEELRSYLADQANVRYWGNGGGGLFSLLGGAMPTNSAEDNNTDNSTSNSQTETSSDPFSTTTIQEAGVDESDVVKNDGEYIYVLVGSTVHVVQVTPPESTAELSMIEVEGAGDSLYLHGDKLIVLSRQYTYNLTESAVGGALNDGFQTAVTIIDVSDHSNPTVEATVRFEGNLASSRLIDNLLYLVLTTTPRLPSNPTQLAIEAMPLEDWLPKYQTVTADGASTSGDIAGWQNFYRPENPDGYGITAAVTLDVDSPTTPFKATAISASAGVIYASAHALYITDTNYDYDSNVSRGDTVIHKLAFTSDGTAYRGSGLVPGRLLNQYSLGEYHDYLRVATTVEEYGFVTATDNANDTATTSVTVSTPRRDNNVYVLGEAGDGTLTTVGQLEGLAPDERIYSARFVGNRGFLVTFRRVDPLFTLDLSDPTNPTEVGRLEVPGYSDFIQPMDENHLLTIGKGVDVVDSFDWVQGIKLAIFDVSDFANPALLFTETIGGRGSNSEANGNPKAFNYFPARQALAFPADVYGLAGGGSSLAEHEFTGLYVYHVTLTEGFQLLGRIPTTESTASPGCFYAYSGSTRGVFIGDSVYSVTQRNVKAASLDAIETLIGQAVLSDVPDLVQNCFIDVRNWD